MRICKCEKGYVADTLRTFLEAGEVNHNRALLLGAVKTTGGRGGGEEGRKRWGRVRVKFREEMLMARWKVGKDEEKPKEERRWEAKQERYKILKARERERKEMGGGVSRKREHKRSGWDKCRSEKGEIRTVEKEGGDFLPRINCKLVAVWLRWWLQVFS